MAALSSLAWSAYSGVIEQQDNKVAQVELMQFAAALQRFRADTGYWPGESVFELDSDSDSYKFDQLYEQPQLDANHPLAFLQTWNPNTHRGWNGPYLPIGTRKAFTDRAFQFNLTPKPCVVHTPTDGKDDVEICL